MCVCVWGGGGGLFEGQRHYSKTLTTINKILHLLKLKLAMTIIFDFINIRTDST